MDLNNERMTKTYKHFAEPVRTADALETCLARTGSLTHIHRCQTRVNRE